MYENLDTCIFCDSANITSIDEENSLCQCTTCGLIFDNPRPVAREIEIFYSRPSQYDSWLENLPNREILWKKRLARIAKIRNSGKLLDIGAGIGQFLHVAKVNFDVSGTEISDSAIQTAKRLYDIDVMKGDIENLSLKKEDYDIITLFHVLEHVPSPGALLRKCQELLTSDGILVIAVPNDIESYKARIKSVFGSFRIGRFRTLGKFGLPPIILDGSLPEIHISHFRASVLENGLRTRGFTVSEESLDRAYAEDGFLKLLHDVEYGLLLMVYRIFHTNLYDTIWIVAQKQK